MPGLVMADGHRPTITPQPRQPAHARTQSTDVSPTNTLILTSLPAAFFHPSVLNPLRSHFETYGPIHSWAPLKSFGRIIVTFQSVEDAERLREECDGLHVGGPDSELQTLRLYRGQMTSIEPVDPETLHLQVPQQTKNFLISPPGSPPVGWEPIEEEPPNTASLAADLIAALTRLQQQDQNTGEEEDEGPARSDGKQVLLDTERDHEVQHRRSHTRTNSGTLLVLLEDTESKRGKDGDKTPDEVVEMLDPRHEMSSSRGQSPPRRTPRLPPTAMPPSGFGSITSVKATVESMRTPMPPPPPPSQ